LNSIEIGRRWLFLRALTRVISSPGTQDEEPGVRIVRAHGRRQEGASPSEARMAQVGTLKMRTKLAFGVGAAAEAGIYIAFNSFNMLFYNQVLGLSGTLCGLAVTIALVLDAIADPVIGFASDRWKSKLGRRHPFLYAAPIPVAISFYCIYSPPEGLSNIPLFLWFATFTLMCRQALSLYHVPHLALGAELSNDYHERSIVMSYNSIFAVIGGAGAAWFGWTWFGSVEGGKSNAGAYSSLAAVIALMSAVIIFASAHFTRDQIPRLPQPPANQARATLRIFFEDSFSCLRNLNYRNLLFGLLFLSAMIGTRETLQSYLGLFFWELPETKMRTFALASPPAFVISFFLTWRLHRWFEKRSTIIGSGIVSMLGAALPVLLRLAGVFPENGTPGLLPALLFFHFVFYLGFSLLTISVMSALADIADDHELLTGRRQEGMFYAARTFFGQLSSGLGHLFAGLAIDVINFPTGAKPGQVADEVLFKLGLVDGPIAAIPAFIALFFYARYRINKQRHAEIQRELAARRGSVATARSSIPLVDPEAIATAG
jgi:GPH family glycoside/pentoside/hexuronide:cation symporter